MTSCTEHYARHLAPVYIWMAGGLDAAYARGMEEIRAITTAHDGGLAAVDLGAGFGMHALPLARTGYDVMAIDTSSMLLEVLQEQADGLPLQVVVDDLLCFADHIHNSTDLVLCMGDTLTHLPDRDSVRQLFSLVQQNLRPGGSFVITFRDYSNTPGGASRFIPVRSDEDRILTCFLEYFENHISVHDLLHERKGSGWELRVSAYQKLRLHPDWITNGLQQVGFIVRMEPWSAGMLRVTAVNG